jgi:hypothetical protein
MISRAPVFGKGPAGKAPATAGKAIKGLPKLNNLMIAMANNPKAKGPATKGKMASKGKAAIKKKKKATVKPKGC